MLVINYLKSPVVVALSLVPPLYEHSQPAGDVAAPDAEARNSEVLYSAWKLELIQVNIERRPTFEIIQPVRQSPRLSPLQRVRPNDGQSSSTEQKLC